MSQLHPEVEAFLEDLNEDNDVEFARLSSLASKCAYERDAACELATTYKLGRNEIRQAVREFRDAKGRRDSEFALLKLFKLL